MKKAVLAALCLVVTGLAIFSPVSAAYPSYYEFYKNSSYTTVVGARPFRFCSYSWGSMTPYRLVQECPF